MSNSILVTHEEEYKIFDMLASQAKKEKRLGVKGWVQIFLDRQKVFEGSNLIVAKGREFVAQKIFGTNVLEDGTTRPNYTGYFVSHFAVGSGGATISGTTVNLTGPLISDNNLYIPISLGDETYLEEPSRYQDTTESPIVHTYNNSVKPIVTGGEIHLEPVTYEGSVDYYTKIKCTCVVPAGEPSMLSSGESVPISEAGLYFVNSSLPDTSLEKTLMFAHICFPPKWKEKESELQILWYILC